jgi:hypothetical protein
MAKGKVFHNVISFLNSSNQLVIAFWAVAPSDLRLAVLIAQLEPNKIYHGDCPNTSWMIKKNLRYGGDWRFMCAYIVGWHTEGYVWLRCGGSLGIFLSPVLFRIPWFWTCTEVVVGYPDAISTAPHGPAWQVPLRASQPSLFPYESLSFMFPNPDAFFCISRNLIYFILLYLSSILTYRSPRAFAKVPILAQVNERNKIISTVWRFGSHVRTRKRQHWAY